MDINQRQKKFIIVGAMVVIVMGFFPPWTTTHKSETYASRSPDQYSFIFNPPQSWPALGFGVELDISRLTIQWIIVLVATGLAVFLTSSNRKDE